MQLETLSYQMGVGWSQETFPPLDSSRTLLIVFGPSEIAPYEIPLSNLISHYPHSHVMGCSSAGEIFDTIVRDDSLTVAIIQFETSDVATAIAKVDQAEDSFEAGSNLAKQLMEKVTPTMPLRHIFVLSDGLHVNGSSLVKGLNSEITEGVGITGGLAGDGDRFQSTWVLHEKKPSSKIVSAVGLYGHELAIQYGSKGGWDIFGPERTITRSKGNILYEIDNLPALSLYKKYLGDRAAQLPAAALLFPLTIRENSQSTQQLVRTILSVDEASQSMTFAGDMPCGWQAQLMRANFERLIDGAFGAASLACKQTEKINDDPTLAIAISCVGRRLVLGERIDEEVEAILDVLPHNAQQIGFYSYGEIAPNGTHNCELHNQTMTITTFKESSARYG